MLPYVPHTWLDELTWLKLKILQLFQIKRNLNLKSRAGTSLSYSFTFRLGKTYFLLTHPPTSYLPVSQLSLVILHHIISFFTVKSDVERKREETTGSLLLLLLLPVVPDE